MNLKKKINLLTLLIIKKKNILFLYKFFVLTTNFKKYLNKHKNKNYKYVFR